MKYSQTFVFLFILGYVTNIADLLVICQLIVSQQGYPGELFLTITGKWVLVLQIH